MMKIMQKDHVAAMINEKTGEVIIADESKLPLDIYLEETNESDGRINNIINFQSWCAGRVLSLDRENAKAILNSCGLSQSNTDKDRCEVAKKYNCLSLNDYFWTQPEECNLKWDDINLYNNSLSKVVVDISLIGKNLTVENTHLIAPEISTPGVFPKAWVREHDGFYLYKGDKCDSVRKEVEASKILQKLGIPVLNYDYAKWDNVNTSKCKIFTSQDICYISAEHYEYNSDIKNYTNTSEYYNLLLSTYLIGDSDKHWGNWGLLYNENGIIGISPLMDFNHAFESVPESPSLPHKIFDIKSTTTQLEAALEALEHVSYNKEVDLSEFHYGDFVKQRIKQLEIARETIENNKKPLRLMQSGQFLRGVETAQNSVAELPTDSSHSKNTNKNR